MKYVEADKEEGDKGGGQEEAPPPQKKKGLRVRKVGIYIYIYIYIEVEGGLREVGWLIFVLRPSSSISVM